MTATLSAPVATGARAAVHPSPLMLAPVSSEGHLRRGVMVQVEVARRRTHAVVARMEAPYPPVAGVGLHEHPDTAPCLTCATAVRGGRPNRTVSGILLNTLALHHVDEQWNLRTASARVKRRVRDFRVTDADMTRQFGPHWGRILSWALTLAGSGSPLVNATADLGAGCGEASPCRPELDWLMAVVLTDVYGPQLGRTPLPHAVRTRTLPYLARYAASVTPAPNRGG